MAIEFMDNEVQSNYEFRTFTPPLTKLVYQSLKTNVIYPYEY